MRWEEWQKGLVELDPDDRLWEYDDNGTKIYKLKCGFGLKTVWDGGYAYWLKLYGHDWEKDDKRK